ncbi:cell division ATP-binding protein FtsE [Lewinella sp. 4G2]|uniref:cell division ATP-binding protein FtsE n=1 Tax=Lewinella sp. 4G2 TaxID=1803372 RepID=UPI0007B4C67F|nr:ATP-binding cassette domain-containing protein [Lewinella sp. 4G2]OAV46022.1 phosphonate ABC transporter ATP-binding protein [Lewinella sp. 4G2]
MSTPAVQLRQASIHQGDREVLGDVNLEMAPGEFVYLVGKTGAGKSSLLKTLYGALPLKGGEGTVAGTDLRKLKRRQLPKLRRQLGIIFQDLNLLTDRTVDDNLHFVLRATGMRKQKERDSRIAEVLHAVGLPAVGGQRPFTLSGGEQQRIAVARALLNQPKLIIADEITGNLDPETSLEMLNLMRELARQQSTAILFATHDDRLRESYQARTLHCVDGKVIND